MMKSDKFILFRINIKRVLMNSKNKHSFRGKQIKHNTGIHSKDKFPDVLVSMTLFKNLLKLVIIKETVFKNS